MTKLYFQIYSEGIFEYMNMHTSQLWFIGGGEVHESREVFLDRLNNYPYEIGGKYYDWKGWIASGLVDRCEIIKPDFPNKQSADYDAWKIWFEKYIEKYFSNSSSKGDQKEIPTATVGQKTVTIIAHSLGGIFIAKYLSENTFPVNIKALHLIAPVFDDVGLHGEIVGNFAFDPKHLENLEKQVQKIHLWHSVDDPIVPYTHSERFQKYLPDSVLHAFENRGHFVNQAHFVELFLELI